jgi:dTDP-4-amino-4,6-dideoxygalactose transaminase
MLDRRWFSNDGPYVQELEHKIAEYLGVNHCIVMCNGTIALEIAIRALELKGEVIVPSFTFIATAHSLQWQEITPVFCDIDHLTHHIDPKNIEKMITPRTTGILGVHTWGRPCDIEALYEVAHKHNLKLLFDAAHAFGCSYKGKMIGNFGNAEVFSFHATKFFNTFEGGAVVTNNDELAKKMRLMKNFGFAGYDNVIYIGTNGKMNETSAAMGLINMESIDEFIAINRRNYECYNSYLEDIPGIKLQQYDHHEKQNYQYIIMEVDESEAGLSRDELLKVLHAENILARRYFYPGCHRMEPYRSYFPHAHLLLPVTEEVAKRVVVLPTGSSIEPQSILTICQIVRLAVENGKDVRKQLSNDIYDK